MIPVIILETLKYFQNATLPARVNGNGVAPAARGAASGLGGGGGPSRHFRPFDHRRMNPMEDIHENPYAVFKVSGSIVEEEAKRRSIMAFSSLCC